MNIRFLSIANQEVDDAVAWHNEQTDGLGRDFLDELDRVVRLIRIYPLVATQVDSEIRQFLFSRLALPQKSNSTNGSWWMVQILPTESGFR